MSQNGARKNSGFCPECNEPRIGFNKRRSTKVNSLQPWTMVLSVYHCIKCKTDIPAHLWQAKSSGIANSRQEWKTKYRHQLDLFEYAKKTKDRKVMKNVIRICDQEIEKSVLASDAEYLYQTKILALIFLKKKTQARELSLYTMAAIPEMKNPKIYSNYICLCLDIGDRSAAMTGLNNFKRFIRKEHLPFLFSKAKSAHDKGVLSDDDLNLILVNGDSTTCPVCSAEMKRSSRYPRRICKPCTEKVTDSVGRKVIFFEKFSDQNFISGGSLGARYGDDESEYPSNYGWIIGGKCKAEVSRFGGIVIQMVADKSSKDISKKYETHSPLPTSDCQKANEVLVEYVDSDGNPISPDKINPNSMTFWDVYGRSVDQFGNLTDLPDLESELIMIAESMMKAKDYKALIEHCEHCIKKQHTKRSPTLWNLLGIGYGALNKPTTAKECFLKSIQYSLPGTLNSVTFGNYVTSSFASEDFEEAVRLIENHFDGLDQLGKRIVLESLNEFCHANSVEDSDLSEKIRSIMKSKAS